MLRKFHCFVRIIGRNKFDEFAIFRKKKIKNWPSYSGGNYYLYSISDYALKIALLTTALVAILCARPARAIDAAAGSYTPAQKGTNLALYYNNYSNYKGNYDGGKPVSGPGVESDISMLRLVHFTELNGIVIDPQVIIPYGSIRGHKNLSGLGKAKGMGDLILTATIFVFNNPKDRTYFGITPYLFIPTGEYDKNKSLNIGENRWKFALQVGYDRPINSRLSMSLASDVTFFGKNNDHSKNSLTLTQKPLFYEQAWLTQKITSSLDFRVGAFYAFGGNKSIDGISQSNRTSTTTFRAGIGWMPTPKTQVLVTYGRDDHVENGLAAKDIVNLRGMLIF